MGRSEPPVTRSQTHSRGKEPGGRSDVTRGTSGVRVEIEPSHSAADMAALRGGKGRSVRFQKDNPMPTVVRPKVGRKPPPRGGCVRTQMARRTSVRFPPSGVYPGNAAEDTHRAGARNSGTSRTTSSALVRELDVYEAFEYVEHSSVGGCTVAGGGGSSEPPYDPGAPVEGLDVERLRMRKDGLSDGVIDTIQSARAGSTKNLYGRQWKGFSKWCRVEGVDPCRCSINRILGYLQTLVAHRLAYQTIKCYASAISAYHAGIDGVKVFAVPLLRQFLEGVKRVRPVVINRTPPWELSVVLKALSGPPFEPLTQVSLRFLSIKTALLLALVSTKRSSELCAWSVQEDCIRFYGDLSRVVLRPNPCFIPKVLTTEYRAQQIVLDAFHPAPETEVEVRQHRLCPVRALDIYVTRTAGIRKDQQLFVCYGDSQKGKKVSSQRLAHWLREGITLAYEGAGMALPGKVKGHSTRAIGASAALFKGASVGDICAAATWSSPSPFQRFYLRDMASTSVAHSVLANAEA